MNYIIIAALAVVIAILLYLVTLLNRRVNELGEKQKDNQSFLLLQNQLNEVNKTLASNQSQSSQMMQQQFGQNLGVIKGVTEKIAELQETNKQVMNFSEQLKNLEKVLTSQKQRGNLGEASLYLVLENILPPTSFKEQYQFDDGDTVDAAIFTKDGIIPVDAKFSLENYNRVVNESDPIRRSQYETDFKNDLKKRIDETSKYIKPNMGTMDFAFMFIPAEAIYYDLLVNEVGAVKVNTRSLIDYAFKEKRVIIVSPTTFAAYLQTVLQGLRALKIEEQTKEIIKRVESLQKHVIGYDQFFKKVGNHLATTVNAYNTADKELKKIDKDVIKITGQDTPLDALQLDLPQRDE